MDCSRNFQKHINKYQRLFLVPNEIFFIVPLRKNLPVKTKLTIIAGAIFSKTPKFISRHCKGKRGDLPRQGRGRRGGGEERRRKGKLLNSSLQGGRQGRIWKHVLPPPNKFDSLLPFPAPRAPAPPPQSPNLILHAPARFFIFVPLWESASC